MIYNQGRTGILPDRLFSFLAGTTMSLLTANRRLFCSAAFLAVAFAFALPSCGAAEETGVAKELPRLLLLAQGPDGHPPGTHEYRAGQRVLKKLLSTTPNLEVTIAEAGADWPTDPAALDKVDGVALFIAEGAQWIHADERRRDMFARFAQRGGGLVAFHWAIGTRTAEPIDGFVKLFGACHGGPDRKYKFLETTLRPSNAKHPITTGVEPLRVKEEFYYQLKHARDDRLVWLMEAEIDGAAQPVAWAWERPDGGRSFGFSGLHFHENWSQPSYQRLMAQGALWTLKRTPPENDFPARLTAEDLKLP